MCSQLSGDVWGEPRIGCWLSYLMQVSHGIGNIGGVPEDDRGDDEVEPRGAKLLRFGAAIGDPALLEGTDDLRKGMSQFASVTRAGIAHRST